VELAWSVRLALGATTSTLYVRRPHEKGFRGAVVVWSTSRAEKVKDLADKYRQWAKRCGVAPWETLGVKH
jgi:hypothetical protein